VDKKQLESLQIAASSLKTAFADFLQQIKPEMEAGATFQEMILLCGPAMFMDDEEEKELGKFFEEFVLPQMILNPMPTPEEILKGFNISPDESDRIPFCDPELEKLCH
jgi:hypothetical protein